VGRYDYLYIRPGIRITTVWGNSLVDALNELADVVFNPIVKMRVLDLAPMPGTEGTYGSPVSTSPPENRGWIVVMAKVQWTGEFATGEEVKIKISVTFSDNTEATIEKSSTSPGEAWISQGEIASLWKDGSVVKKIEASSSTNMSTSSVGTIALIYCIEA
jgi:hypothetical protein